MSDTVIEYTRNPHSEDRYNLLLAVAENEMCMETYRVVRVARGPDAGHGDLVRALRPQSVRATDLLLITHPNGSLYSERGIDQCPTRLDGTEDSFSDCNELHIQETLLIEGEDVRERDAMLKRLLGEGTQRQQRVQVAVPVRNGRHDAERGAANTWLPWRKRFAEIRTPPAAHRAVSQCSVVLFCCTVTTQEHKNE